MTNTSLTPVTAIVSMPLPLIAPAFCTYPGIWFLWQVGVNAPGTANNTTFLPLKMSSVVFTAGPSAVITLNLASGNRSPTLIMIRVPLVEQFALRPVVRSTRKLKHFRQKWIPVFRKSSVGTAPLVDPRRGLDGRSARGRRQSQKRAARARPRRDAVEVEREPLQAGGSPGDRGRQRQSPLRLRPFDEQVGTLARRCRNVDDNTRITLASFLTHAADCKPGAIAASDR